MRILALDVGTKTIGVAVSDELGIAAHGVKTIRRKGVDKDIEEIARLIEEYRPCEILVGIPYGFDGKITMRGRDIIKFAKLVERSFSVPVRFWDESFSTVCAEKVLLEADMSRYRRKKVIDKLAAVFILEGYLEMQRAKKQLESK